MKWWVHLLILLVILLLGLAPILSALVAGSIASANGCELNEGGVNPCIMNGRDYGEVLYTMGVLGWLSLATIPLASFAIFTYLVVLIVLRVIRNRKKTPPTNTT